MSTTVDRALAERAIAVLGKDKARLLQAVAQKNTPATARPLREWLANPEMLQSPGIVIPYVAVEGRVTLESGREKIGKSTFTACVVAAASRGDDVLGVPVVQPASCLWYALDEPVADTVRRFDRLGADIDQILINDQPRTATELLAALEEDLANFVGMHLVVVDNLSRVFAMSGVDPNSSREVEPVLAKLVDLFHRENVAAILLYHTGKAGREYRGSTAIGATVDEVLTLRKRGQGEEDDFDDDATDDGRRLLVQEGRNLRGRVHLTCAEGVYRVYEDASPPRLRILDALRDHGTVIGRAELTKVAGVRKATGLHLIGDMILEGVIVENGRNLKLPISHSRELASQAFKVPGAARFPEDGKAPEPRAEPALPTCNPSGSNFLQEGVTEVGTDGRKVRQTLRPTAHGDKWFDDESENP